MKNHLWYLVEELVPLSLFDDGISQSVKAKVGDASIHQTNKEKP